MSDSLQRAYGGQTALERRERRRGRILEAAMDLMARNQWRVATVDKVCAEANLNKRYFYESFTDLDVLSAAVVDEIADVVRVATLAAVEASPGEPLEVQAYAAVAATIRAFVDDPRRARVLLGGVTASPELYEHRADVMNGLTNVLVAHGRTVHGIELEADPLAKVAPAFIVGGTADAILRFVNGDVDLSLDDFTAQVATLWLITGNGAADVARQRMV